MVGFAAVQIAQTPRVLPELVGITRGNHLSCIFPSPLKPLICS